MTSELLSTEEMCRRTRATFRQLDYWDRAGIIHPAVPARGSGSSRRWSPDDELRVRVLAAVSMLTANDQRGGSRLMRLIGQHGGLIKDGHRRWTMVSGDVRLTVEVVS